MSRTQFTHTTCAHAPLYTHTDTRTHLHAHACKNRVVICAVPWQRITRRFSAQIQFPACCWRAQVQRSPIVRRDLTNMSIKYFSAMMDKCQHCQQRLSSRGILYVNVSNIENLYLDSYPTRNRSQAPIIRTTPPHWSSVLTKQNEKWHRVDVVVKYTLSGVLKCWNLAVTFGIYKCTRVCVSMCV